MGQIIYSICALMIVIMLSMNMNRVVHGENQRMMFSEVAQVVTSVGAEVLDEIGKYPYDPIALSSTTIGVLNSRNRLGDPNTFGTNSPCNPDANYSGCLFINDFNGKTATRVRSRLHNGNPVNVTYNVETIRVRYVEEAPPHRPCTETGATCPASGKTFAKQVEVTVSSPELTVGGSGNPLRVTMSRVYTYPNL